MSNFLVDIWLDAEEPKTSQMTKQPSYMDVINEVTTPTVNIPKRAEQEIDLASFGLQNMQEFNLMNQVKDQWGSADDFREVLEETRQQEKQTFNQTFSQEEEDNLSGFDIGVKTGKGLREVAEPFKFQSNVDDGVIESGAKFLANLPANTVQLGWDLISILSDPIGTAQSVGTLATAAIETGLNKAFLAEGEEFFTTDEVRQVSETVWAELSKLWEPGRIKELLVENPTDVLLTVTGWLWVAKNSATARWLTSLADKLETAQKITNPINILAQEAKLVTTPLKAGKSVAASVIGKTTWAGSEAVAQAFRSWGKKTFADALRGNIADEDILLAARRGLETVKENRRALYGDENYQKLISNKTKLDINPMREDLIKKLDEFKVQIDGDGALDFSKSTITQGNSQRQIQWIFDDVMTWQDKTPEGMDILKQRVQDRWIGWEGTAKGDVFSTALGNKIKDRIVAEVPEYKIMTESYQKFSNEIRDIEKVLRIGDEKNKMTAITRLNQALKDNLSFRKEAVELLEQAAGIDLKSSLAGAALRDIMPKGLQWVIGWGAIGLWVTWGLFSPAVISWLLASSPRLIGEIAIAMNIPAATLKKGLQGLKKVQEAIWNKAWELKPTIIEKTKDIIDKK